MSVLPRASTTSAPAGMATVPSGADGGDALADDEQRHARPHDARLGVEEAGAGEGDAGRGPLGERLRHRQPALVAALLLVVDELVVDALPPRRQQREPGARRPEVAAVRLEPDDERLEAQADDLPGDDAPLLAAGGDLDLGQLADGDRSRRQQREPLPGRLRRRRHQVGDLVGRAVVARVEGAGGARALPLLGAVFPGRLAALAGEALGDGALEVLVAVDGERARRAVGAEDEAAVDLGAAAAVVVLEVGADGAAGLALDGHEAGVVAHDARVPALGLGGVRGE